MKPAELLWRVSVATSLEAEDAVAEMLGAVCQRAVSTHFNLETAISTVSVFGETKPAAGFRRKIRAGLRQIEDCGLQTAPGNISIAGIRRENWAESWKRHFRPFEIGGVLLVKPSWSLREPRKNQAAMVLDPGLSFGTGQHPTTAFCLRELARCRNRGMQQSFLDLGTGSGILAVAAAKLGYQPVSAVDVDADAVRIARWNARTNRVGNALRIARADVSRLRPRPGRTYDLICANLSSDLLIAARQRIAAQLSRGGTLVLAGILNREFPQVRQSYENLGLALVGCQRRMEWCSGAFRAMPENV